MADTLMLGMIEGRRRRGRQRKRWLDGITDLKDMNLGKLWEMVRDREAWCSVVNRVAKSWTPDLEIEQQQLKIFSKPNFFFTFHL